LITAFGGRAPRVHPSAFIAPTAVLIGNVEIGPESSVWFGAVLRGDDPDNVIRVGARSSIQDNCVLHVSARGPTLVGDDVTVGHGAVFESCEIRRGALIGMNAVILQDAIIDEEALVAALSVVPAGMHVPPRTLVAGAPAKIRKQLEGSAAEWVRHSASHYVGLSRRYLADDGIRSAGAGAP
jgi:carbonic anhydrase/acetyltransferase-like protein (isoleucine patch superfamily)